jgi:hypothetical protein
MPGTMACPDVVPERASLRKPYERHEPRDVTETAFQTRSSRNMRLPSLLAVATFIVSSPAFADILVDDFEDVSDWSGLQPETSEVHSGTRAGRWDDHVNRSTARKAFSPALSPALDVRPAPPSRSGSTPRRRTGRDGVSPERSRLPHAVRDTEPGRDRGGHGVCGGQRVRAPEVPGGVQDGAERVRGSVGQRGVRRLHPDGVRGCVRGLHGEPGLSCAGRVLLRVRVERLPVPDWMRQQPHFWRHGGGAASWTDRVRGGGLQLLVSLTAATLLRRPTGRAH